MAMIQSSQKIFLSGSDVCFTHDSSATYFVESGQVFVYIIPWSHDKPGRKVLLCEAGANRMIPGFAHRDRDYKQWRFSLVAKTPEAVLVCRPGGATSILQRKFLERAGLDTYAREGFENSLTEFYSRESVKDSAFIFKGQHADPEAKRKTMDTIQSVFQQNEAFGLSGTAWYQTLQFVCNQMHIDLLPPEEILARCGKNPDAPQIARVSHFICRQVVLEADWHRRDCGGLVGTLEGEPVACVLKKGKYLLFRSGDSSVQPLTPELARQISPQAYTIGRTLPVKPLTGKDLVRFCKESITPRDLAPICILALIGALIGILLPTLNQMIYDEYIPLGNVGHLVQICMVILTFMIGNLLFSVVKNLLDFRFTSRMGNDLQSAAYHRLFHLPESFFRRYDSADMGSRVMQVSAAVSSMAEGFVISGISALFCIVYFIRMGTYSWKLTWIGLGMYAVYVLLIFWLTWLTQKGEASIAKAEAAAGSRLFQYLNGVDKIRMAGSEERAALSYMRPFAKAQSEEIKVNRLVSAREALAGIVSTVFSMVLYYVIVKNKINVSIGAFLAFNTAFGSFTGTLNGFVDTLLHLYQDKVLVTRFMPVFKAVPEDTETMQMPGELSGGIQLEHVSFAYSKGGRNVLDDLSLTIRPGEYVGIVGSSGCGKSTLLKLLLGFEHPQSGIVTVDGKDLRSLDKGAYRRQLGVVLQNGKLISGSIYENITITAPQATMAQVNKVIQQVGLQEDIRQMPMGIHTVLSENCNTISGGQQQRILIARAIISDPKLLIFDEATSALDNLTQAVVCSNLDKMRVTRVVVAHRLSTIQNCDRILVLKDGRIAEEGTYHSLMAKGGLFYALASRQIAES